MVQEATIQCKHEGSPDDAVYVPDADAAANQNPPCRDWARGAVLGEVRARAVRGQL